LRVVLDTNILVSALLNERGAPARVLAGYREGRFTLVTSEPLLAELEDVLGRAKIVRRGITPARRAELLDLLRQGGQIVSVAGSIHVCRDPKDNVVIETAVGGDVVAVVTGDADLTDQEEVTAYLAARRIVILPVALFAQLLPRLPAQPQLRMPLDPDSQP
jgi:putative PIN family toxin of toxin-antitoxin system